MSTADDIQEKCLRIFSTIMNKTMTPEMSFVEMGGDSMMAQDICIKIEEEFQVSFKVRELIRLDTLEEIIDDIHTRR
jgi:acyl carrier protein